MKTKGSSATLLVKLIEETVRRVVREELARYHDSSGQGSGTQLAEIITKREQPAPMRPTAAKRTSTAVDRITQKNPILKGILETVTPFSPGELSEGASLADLDLLEEDYSPARSFATTAPAPVKVAPLSGPTGNEAVDRVADILNTTNFKAILDRSKEKDAARRGGFDF